MRPVDEPVQYGVGDGGLAHVAVPFRCGQLAGEDRRVFAVAVFQDFKDVAAVVALEGSQAPVVDDQELRFCDSVEQLHTTPPLQTLPH